MTYSLQVPEELKEETKEPIFITKNIRISTTANNGSVLIISDSIRSEPNINSHLVKAIAKSFYWNELLLSGEAESSIDIQKKENLKTNTYVKYILRLRFLASDIIEAILNGTQPRDLTIENLFTINTLDWKKQREALRF